MSKTDNGFNPLRWNCEKDGCFNKKCRPKIEVFSECFPRRINFGDVDGLVEINGKVLILEWKSFKKPIPTGQRIAYQKMSKDKEITIICLVGNAETMEVTDYMIGHKGKLSEWKPCNLIQAKYLIKRWSDYADRVSA